MADQQRVKREQKPPLQSRPQTYSFAPMISLQHERLIGRVIVLWSKLEAAMQDTLWHFLGLEIEDGRIITARMDAGVLMPALRRLGEIHIREEEKKTAFLNMLTKMEDRRDDRNFIAHGVWGTFGNLSGDPMDGAQPVVMSLKPKSPNPTELISETFPPGRMYLIIDGIREGINFFVDFLGERDPSRDTRQLQHLRP